jgi:hypothetical protein
MLSTSETNQKKFYKIGNIEKDGEVEDMDINLEEVDMVGGADAAQEQAQEAAQAKKKATKVMDFNKATSSRPLDSARYIPSIDREMVDVVKVGALKPDNTKYKLNEVEIRTYSIKFCLIKKPYTFSTLKETLLKNIENEIKKQEYTRNERGLVKLLCATKFMTNIDDVIWCIYKNIFHVKIETDPSKINPISIEDIKFLYDIGNIHGENLKKLIRKLTYYKLLEDTLLLLFNKSYNGKMLNPFDKNPEHKLTDTEQLYAYKIHQFLHVVATEAGSIVVTNQSTTSEEQAPIKEAVADICRNHCLDRRYNVLYFSYLSISTLVPNHRSERSDIKINIKIQDYNLLF